MANVVLSVAGNNDQKIVLDSRNFQIGGLQGSSTNSQKSSMNNSIIMMIIPIMYSYFLCYFLCSKEKNRTR